MELNEIIDCAPKSSVIGDNFIKAYKFINDPKYENILCGISGGADSDIVLDVCSKCDRNRKIKYVWFNTGLEYQATKDHLKVLQSKYNVKILEMKPKKPIPVACKEYGVPFISKQVSEYMSRLQKHNFCWEDDSFEALYKKYPKCKSALQWWCDEKELKRNGKPSSFNISWNKWLKEFLVDNPPKLRISNKCCKYAKKNVLIQAVKDIECDLNISGMRKAEGGIRSSAYKSCFSESESSYDNYMPIWWYKKDDKKIYEEHYKVHHSDCYIKYGLSRTGCVGCPFGKDFEFELKVMKQFEPKLYKMANAVFGKSYDYTRLYREYCNERNKKSKRLQNTKATKIVCKIEFGDSQNNQLN